MPYSDEKIKVLGQLYPTLNVLSEIYAVPSGKDTNISSLTVSNHSSSDGTFSISIAVSNEADSLKQYIYHDLLIPGNETFIATVGFSLSSGDRVRVKSNNGSMSFNVFGAEVTY